MECGDPFEGGCEVFLQWLRRRLRRPVCEEEAMAAAVGAETRAPAAAARRRAWCPAGLSSRCRLPTPSTTTVQTAALSCLAIAAGCVQLVLTATPALATPAAAVVTTTLYGTASPNLRRSCTPNTQTFFLHFFEQILLFCTLKKNCFILPRG